jgi:hypothetical protein
MANYNPNKAKINRNYTYEELAEVYGVHKNTIAQWVIKGLPCLKEMRPFLIMGADVRDYLHARRVSNKQKCKSNELFCMRCKAPTQPAENFVEYLPISSTKGRLLGLCSRCECLINKFVSFGGLAFYFEIFDLAIPKELEQINDSDNPLLNSDQNSELKP